MMTRTQISLPAEHHQGAKARARELNISLAEYLRRLVAGDLAANQTDHDKSALLELFDSGDSGGSDVAAHKHSYLGDAAYAEHMGQASSSRSL